MTRVLFLLAHLHKGGMQRAVSNITRALPEGIEAHLGYFGTERPAYDFAARHHDLALPGRAGDGFGRKLVNARRRLLALRRLVRGEAIDAVVSFGEIANAYNLLAAHGARRIVSIRVDLEAQRAEFGRARRAVGASLDALYRRRAPTIVCVSQALARTMRARAPRADVLAIPNLYPIEALQRQALEPLPDSRLAQTPFVLGVGSLIPQKGFDQLLRAFARVAGDAPQARLVLVGDGPERAALGRMAHALGIGERVDFVGHDPNPARYMARAAVFALSSRFEGFPNVLVEAMACGAPVVAFDCPTGPDEILGASAWGRLLPAQDEAALGAALGEMLGDAGSRARWSAKARERASHFGSAAIIGRWTALLDPAR